MMEPRYAPAPIGTQIRSLRTKQGKTLEEMARAVGTSAPTMHRYEGHYDGYTLKTLRRIARALNADLEVRLIPMPMEMGHPESVRQVSESSLLRAIADLFWDRDLTVHDLHDHPLWVFTRVLNEGDLEQVRTALAYFGPETLRRVLERRDLQPRARRFWLAVLERTD